MACGQSVVRKIVNLYQRGRKLYRSANVGGGQLYYKARSGVSSWADAVEKVGFSRMPGKHAGDVGLMKRKRWRAGMRSSRLKR